MGNKLIYPPPLATPASLNWMPDVWGAEIDPETELPKYRTMTGYWGEFSLNWDDATERQLSGFYLRWHTGGVTPHEE